MSDWSVLDGPGYGEVAGYDSGTNSYTASITAHASNNTKGNYTQLIASTTKHIKYMTITPGYIFAIRQFLVDIAVGAAGSEVVIVPNLLLTQGQDGHVVSPISFPISIPAGTRIAARCQCSTGGTACGIALGLFSSGFATPDIAGLVTAYGAATGTSGGTSIDPGAVAQTKGSWVEISSSINSTRLLFAAIGNQNNNVRTWSSWRIDIGVGAAESEVVVIPDIHLVAGSSDDSVNPKFTSLYPFCVPSGTRVAVRAQCEITDSTDRKFDVVLYGIS